MTKRLMINTAVFSMLLSLAVLTALHIPYEGSMYVLWTKMKFEPFGVTDVFSFVLIWSACTGCLLLAGRAAAIVPCGKIFRTKGTGSDGGRRVFLISFAVIFLAWITLFMAYLPGTGFVDSYLIMQNGIRMSRQHPWFYNLLLWGFARIGEVLFGDINPGIVGYSLCQMMILAAAVAGCTVWLQKKGVAAWMLWLVRLYYVIMPVFGLYSFSAIKDSLFAVFFLVLLPLIWEMLQSRGEVWQHRRYSLAYLACCAGMILFRNNGVYIVIVITMLLAWMFRAVWKKVVLAALIPIILFSALPSLGLTAMGKGMYFQEAVAIPLQQMVSVVVNDGEMTTEQKEFMERILPAEQMKAQYYPMNADLIKWDEDFDREYLQDHKGDFLKYWFQMMLPNFSIYVEAYLMQTYTFWSPVPLKAENVGYSAPLSHEELGIVPSSMFPDVLTERIHQWINEHNYFLSPGTMIWMIFLFLAVLGGTGKIREMVVYVPQIFLWGTLMVSVPVAESFRYVFPIAYSLPFSLIIFFFAFSEHCA